VNLLLSAYSSPVVPPSGRSCPLFFCDVDSVPSFDDLCRLQCGSWFDSIRPVDKESEPASTSGVGSGHTAEWLLQLGGTTIWTLMAVEFCDVDSVPSFDDLRRLQCGLWFDSMSLVDKESKPASTSGVGSASRQWASC